MGAESDIWFWLSAGLLFAMAECLLLTGFFIWLACSAGLVWIACYFFPSELSASMQGLMFGILSLVVTFVWWKIQTKIDKESDKNTKFNEKQNQLIGKIIAIDEDFVIGVNRIRIADTTWSANCDSNIPKGTVVEVVGVDGIILHVKPV